MHDLMSDAFYKDKNQAMHTEKIPHPSVITGPELTVATQKTLWVYGKISM